MVTARWPAAEEAARVGLDREDRGSIFKRAMRVYDVLRPEEVMALVRAATDEQDAALFHTVAFAGLRMGELLALRWRDTTTSSSALNVVSTSATSR